MAAIKDLHNELQEVLAECRKMVEAAEKSGSPMDAETRQKYDELWEKRDQLKARIEDQQRLENAEREAEALTESRGVRSEHERPTPRTPENRSETPQPIEVEVRGHAMSFAPNSPDYERATPAYQAAFQRFLRSGETRSLQADADTAGGYTVPAQFAAQLIQAVDDQVFIRQLGNVMTLNTGESLGVPSLDNDPADDGWVSELNAGSEDTTMDFGKRTLTPHALGKYIKVSNKLLRQSALNVESIVRERLAYKTAITQEKAFLTGSGAQQPLGIFTASAMGVNTTADVSTGNTTTAIGADNLRECFYTLKPQYRGEAVWLMHTDSVKAISKLKDGNGQYLWTPGIRQSDPDMILGRPVYESRYAPNTFTTGLYVGALFAPRFYWIVDSLSMVMQRLAELFSLTDQVGFIIRSDTDGMPVLEEAFVRMTLA